MKKYILLSAVLITAIMLGACSTKKVTRVSPDEQIDLSGRWNDTDSKLTADAMITQSLSEAWLGNFREKNSGAKPVIICGSKTSNGHILIHNRYEWSREAKKEKTSGVKEQISKTFLLQKP